MSETNDVECIVICGSEPRCLFCGERYPSELMARVNKNNTGTCAGCSTKMEKRKGGRQPGSYGDRKSKAKYLQGKAPWMK